MDEGFTGLGIFSFLTHFSPPSYLSRFPLLFCKNLQCKRHCAGSWGDLSVELMVFRGTGYKAERGELLENSRWLLVLTEATGRRPSIERPAEEASWHGSHLFSMWDSRWVLVVVDVKEGGEHPQGTRPQKQKATSRRPWCGLKRRCPRGLGVVRRLLRRLLNATWELWIFSFGQWWWECH